MLIALSFAHYLWFLNFRDQYGFKKESQWLSHHDFVIFETYYIPIMERRRQKWAIFMNDSHGQLPPRSAKRKSLVHTHTQRERDLQGHSFRLKVTFYSHVSCIGSLVKRYIRKGIPPALRGEVIYKKKGSGTKRTRNTWTPPPHMIRTNLQTPDYPSFYSFRSRRIYFAILFADCRISKKMTKCISGVEPTSPLT